MVKTVWVAPIRQTSTLLLLTSSIADIASSRGACECSQATNRETNRACIEQKARPQQ